MNNDAFNPLESGALSERGERRRERILELAQTAAGGRRKRRRLMQGAALAALIIAGGSTFFPRHAPIVPAPSIVNLATRPSEPPKPGIAVVYIKTDETLAKKLAIVPHAQAWQRIRDDALLEELSLSGRPAALAWINNHPVLFLDRKAGDSNR